MADEFLIFYMPNKSFIFAKGEAYMLQLIAVVADDRVQQKCLNINYELTRLSNEIKIPKEDFFF